MSQDPSAMRASDVDRDRTADVLKEAVAEGRLRPEEYEDRLSAALTAPTYGELDRLVADLPASPKAGTGQALAPAAQAPAPPQDRWNGLAVGAFISSLAVPGVGGIVAIILGHIARRQIRETDERGDGLAIAGLIIGYGQLILAALVLAGLMIAIANEGGDVGGSGPAPDVPDVGIPEAPDVDVPEAP